MKILVTFLVISLAIITVNSLDLRGKWKEDQNRREGLNDFLYSMGMSWFRRLYFTSSNWENEQTIFQDGNNIRVNGIKGPNQEVYEHHLVADNSTVTQIDFGEFGGQRDAIAEFKDNALIAYLKPKDEKLIDMIATRSISAESPDVMVYSVYHIPSGVKYVNFMNKQI